MDVLELLKLRGLDLDTKIKLVRHMGDRDLVPRVLELGLLEEFQRYQKPFFKECDFIVSFIGEEGSLARLLGVYRLTGSQPIDSVPQALLGAKDIRRMRSPASRACSDVGRGRRARSSGSGSERRRNAAPCRSATARTHDAGACTGDPASQTDLAVREPLARMAQSVGSRARANACAPSALRVAVEIGKLRPRAKLSRRRADDVQVFQNVEHDQARATPV